MTALNILPDDTFKYMYVTCRQQLKVYFAVVSLKYVCTKQF